MQGAKHYYRVGRRFSKRKINKSVNSDETPVKKWARFEAEALPLMDDIFRVANCLTRDRDIAEDLTQETFMEALKSFHRYTPDTNCRAWLVMILYHLNSKRRYKLGRLKIVPDTEELIAETIVFVPPPPTEIEDRKILQALRKLPPTFREVVVLSDVEEFSYKEVAEFLNVPIGTVMSRLHRGRKMLRKQLIEHAQNFGIAVKN